MKYYAYTCKGLSLFRTDKYDIDKFTAETNKDKTVFKLCFDENTRDEFFEAIDYENFFKAQNSEAVFIGEDGYLYAFMSDGTIEKRGCFSKKQERKQQKMLNSFEKKRKREDTYRQALVESTAIGTTDKKGIGAYDKYIYRDGKSDFVIPFRFKKAKNKNAPLLIYFGGAGTLGHDNFKPLFEFKSFFKHLPEDCNILIPQAYFGINFGIHVDEKQKEYINKIIEIIQYFSKSGEIDTDRIYCVGTSFGGGCVWECIFSYEKVFAAAVPVMGMLLNRRTKILKFIENYNGLPIWIAHSSDDDNVRIDSDDEIYSALVKRNPGIQYTRWDKYGHGMARKFYKTVPFVEWMFLQKKIPAEGADRV